ncbi:MAG TPA: GNAT family protein, partial [Thermomicrobiaceae bacterium]|nr:GNAT family protein [Thermomicrobiaceae bacterium]
AWFDSPFPINASRAAEFLREEHREPWSRRRTLAMVRAEGDEVVGGVRIRVDGRSALVGFHLAPWAADADAVRAEALGLLVPWLRGELECLVVTAEIPADEPATLRAAEAAGMRCRVRLREHVARAGHRVDLLIHQTVDPTLEDADA